jgi:hypothetical protein
MPKTQKKFEGFPLPVRGVVRRLQARGIPKDEINEIIYGVRLSENETRRLVKFVQKYGAGSFKMTNGVLELTPPATVKP